MGKRPDSLPVCRMNHRSQLVDNGLDTLIYYLTVHITSVTGRCGGFGVLEGKPGEGFGNEAAEWRVEACVIDGELGVTFYSEDACFLA